MEGNEGRKGEKEDITERRISRQEGRKEVKKEGYQGRKDFKEGFEGRISRKDIKEGY
jgi:hypothetical protein